MTTEQDYDAIDLLADQDPIALRDLAWKLLAERDQLRADFEASEKDVTRTIGQVHNVGRTSQDFRVRLIAMQAARDELVAALERTQAERDAMRPVVEAAKAWFASIGMTQTPQEADLALAVAAVDTADSDQAHRYTSTACHHGRHGDCATGGTRWDGTSKVPAQCKWCAAKCECRECDHAGSHDNEDHDTRRSTVFP